MTGTVFLPSRSEPAFQLDKFISTYQLLKVLPPEILFRGMHEREGRSIFPGSIDDHQDNLVELIFSIHEVTCIPV